MLAFPQLFFDIYALAYWFLTGPRKKVLRFPIDCQTVFSYTSPSQNVQQTNCPQTNIFDERCRLLYFLIKNVIY